MHASIWKLQGDPADLLDRYDALLAEMPTANMRLHLCLRASDGIVIVDTCPSRQVFQEFTSSEIFSGMLERHGLPFPSRLDDFPVHAAIVDGRHAPEASVPSG
ncbi:MAG: hypothetical protein QOD65_638 [Gaiellales bacterium]|jgi:hypothetical protein|nr:hypothetical protein [Gaiellales bacterium]MDX6598598.1 hypothetical protein [Gaiellales bacterium]